MEDWMREEMPEINGKEEEQENLRNDTSRPVDPAAFAEESAAEGYGGFLVPGPAANEPAASVTESLYESPAAGSSESSHEMPAAGSSESPYESSAAGQTVSPAESVESFSPAFETVEPAGGDYGNAASADVASESRPGIADASEAPKTVYDGQPTPRRPYVSPYDAYRFNGGTRPDAGTQPVQASGTAARTQPAAGEGTGYPAQPGAGQTQGRAYGNYAAAEGQTPSWRMQPVGGPYGQPGYDQRRFSGENRGEPFAGNGGGYGQRSFSEENSAYRKETFAGGSGGGFGPGGPSDPKGPSEGSKKKGGKGRKVAAVLGIAVLFGLVAALVFFGVNRLMGGFLRVANNTESSSPAPEPPKVVIGSNDRDTESRQPAGRSDTEESGSSTEKPSKSGAAENKGEDMSIPDVVDLVMPSMVAITNTSLTEYRSLFGERGQYENVSTGSGIIVGETDTDYLIATNDHVISDSNKLTVTFIDDNVVEGEVSATDSRNDLAIVSVKKSNIAQETLDQIRVITIGNSDDLRVGETVIAIGNALGYGQSVSCGVVSAVNRTLEVDGVPHYELLQTDASINPGNSGGALINLRGELVGINEVKAVNTSVEGVGYAIPMSTAKPILENLGTKAARTKVDDEHASYIGIHCMTMSNYYVQMGYPAGAYVSDVMKDGPAEAAGLKEGDIITAIDGSSVTTSNQLISYLEYYAAGEKVNFTVRRLNEAETGFDVLDIEITLGNRNEANFETQGELG